MSCKQNDDFMEQLLENQFEIQRKVDDLTIKAMLFDMDVDWETFQIIPKDTIEPKPKWLRDHIERTQDGDNSDMYAYQGAE